MFFIHSRFKSHPFKMNIRGHVSFRYKGLSDKDQIFDQVQSLENWNARLKFMVQLVLFWSVLYPNRRCETALFHWHCDQNDFYRDPDRGQRDRCRDLHRI